MDFGSSQTAFQAAPATEWKGLTSDKFRYPERQHFAPKDMMKTIEGADISFLGRKHYEPAYGTPTHQKFCLRPFPNLQNGESIRNEEKVKTKPEVKPTARPYGHKQKRYLSQDESDEALYRAQVKTFYPMTQDSKEIHLDKQMGRKRVIDSLEDQRNLVGVKCLGDKSYKYPEYSAGFYHERGLVPGSSNTFKTTKKPIHKTIEVNANTKKGMTWKDRVKMEEKNEEEKAVLSLFEWEQTTLKEGNPKWRDPDAVEPELPKVIDQKNVKKPAAKK